MKKGKTGKIKCGVMKKKKKKEGIRIRQAKAFGELKIVELKRFFDNLILMHLHEN